MRTKKAIKFGILFSIKEGVLFLKNLYGLCSHPLLTTSKIVKEKDISQGLLIFGLPIYFWLAWIFVLLVSRIFIFRELRFGFWAKFSFLASSLISTLIFFVLANFLLTVIKKERRLR